MQVAVPTTPAQYFHLLRRQVRPPGRKPLIVMTPKTMLRLKQAVSPVARSPTGRSAGSGRRAGSGRAAHEVRRVLLCSGKIYYDLAENRDAGGGSDVAIVRVERLYPMPAAELAAAVARYRSRAGRHLGEEEPANMGAWPYMALRLPDVLGRPVRLVSLPPSSAPAAGLARAHAADHARLVEAALSAEA